MNPKMPPVEEKDGLFKSAESLVISETEEVRVCKHNTLVDLNGWLLYVHEAERVRDWLNEVLP